MPMLGGVNATYIYQEIRIPVSIISGGWATISSNPTLQSFNKGYGVGVGNF
ncbi:MAG: hypothetical protein JRN02_01595 [Nitrososphaerota archaeon]|nr:hypothetical protein [Nitrososphaerota archaeon]